MVDTKKNGVWVANKNFTSSTSYSYTGKYFTLSPGYWTITVIARYVNGAPKSIAIHEANSATSCFACTSNEATSPSTFLSTTLSIVTVTNKTFYIFAKYSNASSNQLTISGYGLISNQIEQGFSSNL